MSEKEEEKLEELSLLFKVKKMSNYFGWVIGIISAILTIVVYFDKQEVDIKYEVLQNISALEVKENLPDLDIIYKDKNLIDENQDIQIMTIRLLNSGNQIVREDDYARNDFGLELKNGVLIENPKLIYASNNFLKENFSFQVENGKKMKIKKLIMEPGENIEFKLYILNDKDEKVSLEAFGKVAGIKEEIEVLMTRNEISEPFLNSVFKGGFLIQVIRGMVYGLSGTILIILSLYYSLKIDGYYNKLKRKRKVKLFKKKNETKLADELIFLNYIDQGWSYYRPQYRNFLIQEKEHINEMLETQEIIKKYDDEGNKRTDSLIDKYFEDEKKFEKVLDKFKEVGIFVVNGGRLVVVEERRKVYLDFTKFISEHKKSLGYIQRLILKDD